MSVFNMTGGGGGDPALLPENIRKGVTVLRVTGTMPPTVVLTQAAYDAMTTHDADTLYLVVSA